MLRLFTRLTLLAVAVLGAGLVVRAVLAGRAPRRALDGSGPILGSIDTWPPVPRKEPAA